MAELSCRAERWLATWGVFKSADLLDNVSQLSHRGSQVYLNKANVEKNMGLFKKSLGIFFDWLVFVLWLCYLQLTNAAEMGTWAAGGRDIKFGLVLGQVDTK